MSRFILFRRYELIAELGLTSGQPCFRFHTFYTERIRQAADDQSRSPDAVTGDDHEVVVLVEGQNFDVGHCRNHLLLWRQSLVPLIEVVA